MAIYPALILLGSARTDAVLILLLHYLRRAVLAVLSRIWACAGTPA